MRQDALYSFLSPLKGRILCDNNKVLVGNADGIAIPTSELFPIEALPDLTLNKTWVGNSSNRPEERIYVGDATFVIRIPDANLPSAQALNSISIGILKVIADGYLAQAESGTDYATVTQLTLLAAQIEGARRTIEAAKTASVIDEGAALGSSLIAAGLAAAAENSWHGTEDYITLIYGTGLNELPNHGDVDIQGYRVTNIKQSPEGDFDAVSFTFLDDLMNGQVEILFP